MNRRTDVDDVLRRRRHGVTGAAYALRLTSPNASAITAIARENLKRERDFMSVCVLCF